MNRSVHAGISLLLILYVIGSDQVFAQAPKPYNNDNQFQGEDLKAFPELPYLAPFPNADFSSAMVFKKESAGPCFNVAFHSKEKPEQVIQWYTDTLKNSHWTVHPGGGQQLSAMRKDAIVAIMVISPIKKGFASQVHVRYKITGKH